MKMTLIEWALYPNTEEEAQHAMRFATLKRKIPHLIKSGYTEKVKRIFVLMGFNKLCDLQDEPEHLKNFEKYFNELCANKFMRIQDLEGLIYPDYPPAPYNPSKGKRFA